MACGLLLPSRATITTVEMNGHSLQAAHSDCNGLAISSTDCPSDTILTCQSLSSAVTLEYEGVAWVQSVAFELTTESNETASYSSVYSGTYDCMVQDVDTLRELLKMPVYTITTATNLLPAFPLFPTNVSFELYSS